MNPHSTPIFCFSKNPLYVSSALHTQGRDFARQKKAGFFYVRLLEYNGSVLPCGGLMAPLPLRCNATGYGWTVSFFSLHLNFLKMHYTEKKPNLSILKERWAVAELQLSYRPYRKTGVIISSSEDAYRVFMEMWDHSLIHLQEQFTCLYLSQCNEVIAYRLINTCKASSGTVDVSLILSCALICRAQGIIVAHNHPSGCLRPSLSDKKLTREIEKMVGLFDIKLLDHLIIHSGEYYSFADSKFICNL